MATRRRTTQHLSVERLADHWDVDTGTVRKLIRAGLLHAHRVGRAIRVSPEEIARFEREQRLDVP